METQTDLCPTSHITLRDLLVNFESIYSHQLFNIFFYSNKRHDLFREHKFTLGSCEAVRGMSSLSEPELVSRGGQKGRQGKFREIVGLKLLRVGKRIPSLDFDQRSIFLISTHQPFYSFDISSEIGFVFAKNISKNSHQPLIKNCLASP